MATTLTPVHRALHAMRQASKVARGVNVMYVHKTLNKSVLAVAVLGRTTTELETENSVHRGEKLHDFLIDAVDILAEPDRGDYILWDGRRYLVTHAPGEKVFYYHDSGRNSYRIHTIEISYQCPGIPEPPLPPVDPPPVEPPVDPPVDPPPPTISAYGIGPDANQNFYGDPDGNAYRPPP